MYCHLIVFLLVQLIPLSYTDHYKGGTISWKPVNPSLITGSTVDVIITERHSWTLSRYPCNNFTINTLGPYNDTENVTAPAVFCLSSSADCIASQFINITHPLYCTDYSTFYQISTGTYYTTQTLAINSTIDIGWQGVSWANEVLTNSFSLLSHMDLTPIDDKINTSPVSGSLPIFQVYVGQPTSIQILVGDVDTEQDVRCRWANQLPLDECGDVCLHLPNARLSATECIINWTPVLRAQDMVNGTNVSIYVIAIMVEDFANESSTIPLSSVPHQVLVHVSQKPSYACGSRPSVSGLYRRNMACFGLSAGGTNTFQLRAYISGWCTNTTIVDFITSSPLFTARTPIFRVDNYTWGMDAIWDIQTDQTGLQPFCMAAVDSDGQMSSQYCVMIMVGGTNPGLYTPLWVQSTATPVGTVLRTHQRFSIQATLPLKRPLINLTYIYFTRLDLGIIVRTIDVKTSPDVFIMNNTLTFFVRNPPWQLGVTYYITINEGVLTSNTYCGVEGGGYGGYGFWQFTIWDPSLTSTLTPSTTTSTATTHTVTTRTMASTTPDLLYTTTGIPAYTTTTVTTTTSTTTTTVTTSTTTSVTTTTTTTTTTTQYVPNLDVLYPKDLEQGCLQTITIMTAVIAVVFIPLHLLLMINLMSSVISNCKKQDLKSRIARRYGLPNDVDTDEEEEERDKLL